MKVKHAEIKRAACEVTAVVVFGSHAIHVELGPSSYLSTDRCFPLYSELKVLQDTAGVWGKGTCRDQIMLLKRRGVMLSFKVGVGVKQKTRCEGSRG